MYLLSSITAPRQQPGTSLSLPACSRTCWLRALATLSILLWKHLPSPQGPWCSLFKSVRGWSASCYESTRVISHPCWAASPHRAEVMTWGGESFWHLRERRRSAALHIMAAEAWRPPSSCLVEITSRWTRNRPSIWKTAWLKTKLPQGEKVVVTKSFCSHVWYAIEV